MKLIGLDGLGVCPPKETTPGKGITFLIPKGKLKSMGLTSGKEMLEASNIPYTESVVDGAPAYLVGKTVVPNFVPINNTDSMVSSLKSELAADQAASTTETATLQAGVSLPTIDEKKAVGLLALGLLGLAALANEFRSKKSSGALNGLGTPRKKLARLEL